MGALLGPVALLTVAIVFLTNRESDENNACCRRRCTCQPRRRRRPTAFRRLAFTWLQLSFTRYAHKDITKTVMYRHISSIWVSVWSIRAPPTAHVKGSAGAAAAASAGPASGHDLVGQRAAQAAAHQVLCAGVRNVGQRLVGQEGAVRCDDHLAGVWGGGRVDASQGSGGRAAWAPAGQTCKQHQPPWLACGMCTSCWKRASQCFMRSLAA